MTAQPVFLALPELGAIRIGRKNQNAGSFARVVALSEDGQFVFSQLGRSTNWSHVSSFLSTYRPTTADDPPCPLPPWSGVVRPLKDGQRFTALAPERPGLAKGKPYASNDTSPVTPPEPPTPAAPPPSTALVIAESPTSDLMALERRLELRMEQQAKQIDTLLGSLPTLIQATVSAVLKAAPTAEAKPEPDDKDAERKRALREMVKTERPMVEPLLKDFLATRMEALDLRDAKQLERALTPGDIQQDFNLWVETRGGSSPHPYVTFALLEELAPVRRKLKGDRQLVALGRKRQTSLDFAGKGPSDEDVERMSREVYGYACAKLWTGRKPEEARTIALIGKRVREGVSVADLCKAVDGARSYVSDNGGNASDAQATLVFRDAKRVAHLVALAQRAEASKV